MARFIAEIGSNHNRERDRCLELIDAAALAGCQAVKLQVFRVEDLFAPEALARHPELARRRAWELPLELLPAIRERCWERDLELGATPFALWAVDALTAHVDFFKIASYEILWHPLLQACVASGKPVLLSTGMATLQEVAGAMDSVPGADLRLMHCVSGYPTPPAQANLAAIATMRAHFGLPVGWSDHTCDERVVRRAVAHWGASDVELHIDIDGRGNEAGEHNWTPERLSTLIASLAAPSREPDDGAELDGDGIKRPMPIEQPDVRWRADPADGLRPLRPLRTELSRS